VNPVKPEAAYSPDAYPLYFERILRTSGLPVSAASIAFGVIMLGLFLISDTIAGVPALEHLAVVCTELVSLVLALILTRVIRDQSLVGFQSLQPVLKESEHDKLSALLRKALDQRRTLVFAAAVGAAGVVHHILLSYVTWGRIWWYSAVDIVLVGFVWWFVVAGFFWTCTSVAAYSYYASRSLEFEPRIFSHRRMCGLESLGKLSIVPSIAWGAVATFGTLSTFDPTIVEHFPVLIILYLSLDFVIVAGSMTAIFFLPVLGYRAIVVPFKREWSSQVDKLLAQVHEEDILRVSTLDHRVAITNLHLWALSSQIREIRQWPFTLGEGIRFVLSYAIPGFAFIGRLLLFTLGMPIPF